MHVLPRLRIAAVVARQRADSAVMSVFVDGSVFQSSSVPRLEVPRASLPCTLSPAAIEQASHHGLPIRPNHRVGVSAARVSHLGRLTVRLG